MAFRDYKKETLYPNTKVLSGSQILDYAKDPHEFHMKWMLGVENKKSPALMFGSIFSEAFADRDWDYLSYCKEHKVNPRLISLLQKVLPLFPVLPKKNCEYEIIVPIKEMKGWKVRVTLDGYLDRAIIENKTGQLVWNQEVCDNHPQLTLQQWAVWKKTGKLPTEHIVNWVDTSAQSQKPIYTFYTERTLKQLKDFEKSLIGVVANIAAGNFTERRHFW
jgi:hypothetical protein